MNISGPFIRRPIGTSLLAAGLFLVGLLAYRELPVASLPNVDLPAIRVSASLPGADPEIMASTVAAPLERRIGEIAGITELSSWSRLGSTTVVAQFDITRDPNDAARDVQQAINAARIDLPTALSRNPVVRKTNPAQIPIMILALTSTTLRPSEVYELANRIVASRIAQIEGVGEVAAGGAEEPAVRVNIDPASLAAKGVTLEAVRAALTAANALRPAGRLEAPGRSQTLALDAQLFAPEDYGDLVLKTTDGDVLRLRDVANIREGTRNRLSTAWFNNEPAILVFVQRGENANVVDTVDRIKAALPTIRELIPASVKLSLVVDRTVTIQHSITDLQLTLLASVALVMLVVLLFLRRGVTTVAAGITVPLSLAGTMVLMWAWGFSLNNLSLLALTISVGFVVDDAIVMIENCTRNLEGGMRPFEAALVGAGQIGFTVISISVSLLAAFIPILFMGGVPGQFMREFTMTLAFAVSVSVIVSLTVTPMICAHWMKAPRHQRPNLLERTTEPVLTALAAGYARTLGWALRHPSLMVVATLAALGLTVYLYASLPKAFVPRGDTGILYGSVSGAPDISFDRLVVLQKAVNDIIVADPAIAGVGSFIGSAGAWGGSNSGRFYISLVPEAERPSIFDVIDRLREKLKAVPAASVGMYPGQEVILGSRTTDSQYQLTLMSPDLALLDLWSSRLVERLRQIPILQDVTTDRQAAGGQVRLVVDRLRAAQLGVSMRDIADALNNSFAQRQVATLYTPRTQRKVVLEIEPRLQRDLRGFDTVHLTGRDGVLIPLSAVATLTSAVSPLVVNHDGQFPSITISYNLGAEATLGEAITTIRRAVDELHLPDEVKAVFGGEAATLSRSSASEPLLLLAALLAVYLVLGLLYESLIHPITIISTLPSAGLGALLALLVTGNSLSMLTLIGILLLIGIVKKNGIMLVDFALDAERRQGLSPAVAIHAACIARFRPITMTTLAAVLGAVPLIVTGGPGSELRQPLGITIAGGLVVSQILTIYTTPVIYLLLDRLTPSGRRARSTTPAGQPGTL